MEHARVIGCARSIEGRPRKKTALVLLGLSALFVACSSADSSSEATVVITSPDGSATEPEPADGGTPDASAPAPTCSDGAKNGDETDVDCGGACPKCPNGKACLDASDCTGGICKDGRCRSASCSDGSKNGSETDIDCGGDCAKCGTGGACAVASDCESGVCSQGACAAPSCSDSVKNGTETDVDCGGSCNACATGKACALATDCSSGVCTKGVCVEPRCSDGVQNGSETAQDCGGGSCPKCEDGKPCNVDGDCASGRCKTGVCEAAPPPPEPTCTDGAKNGAETDVDCGGAKCPPCVDGKSCAVASDCTSGVCTDGHCKAPSCQDSVKNGDEADVDCGGSCSPCGLGKACRAATDCASGDCEKGACVCPSDKTTCGASCVDTCADNANCGACGNTCASNQACTSSACVGVGLWSFAATWSRDGDADLIVATPNGNFVDPQHRGPDASTDFGRMDRVVTLDENPGKGPENVFWDFDHTPPAGTYLVCVKPVSFDGQSGEAGTPSSPVDVTVVVKKDGQVNTTLRRTFTSFVSADGCSADAPTFLGSVSFPAPRRR